MEVQIKIPTARKVNEVAVTRSNTADLGTRLVDASKGFLYHLIINKTSKPSI